MNFNLKVLETRNKMIQVLDESGLPITVLEYMVSDLYIQIQAQAAQQIQRERSEQNKAEADEPV